MPHDGFSEKSSAPIRDPDFVTPPGDEKRRMHLEMPLPPNDPTPENEDTLVMLDRVHQWEGAFRASAQRALRDVFGYKTAVVTGFECLLGKPGHDENDYELTVKLGPSGSGEIGAEGISMVKIVVRRAAADSLQS